LGASEGGAHSLLSWEFLKVVGDVSKGREKKREAAEEVKAVERIISPSRRGISETMARKLAQADVKIEQEKKKMLLAQHDFKSGQMIQIRDGYATYFTMLQTMVQNYSANNQEIERNKILNKQFETMKIFEDAQWNFEGV
jgi:hypothetical protein